MHPSNRSSQYPLRASSWRAHGSRTLIAVGALFWAPVVPQANADVPPFAHPLRAKFGERLQTGIARQITVDDPRLRISIAPRFLWVQDLSLSLSGSPWMTDSAFLEAFDLARLAWDEADQPDDIRALVVFTSFDVGGMSPFYVPLANDTRGIGLDLFDDSPGRDLEGLIWMGDIRELFDAGPEYYREAFIHEVAHRWTVYIDVALPSLDPGRSAADKTFTGPSSSTRRTARWTETLGASSERTPRPSFRRRTPRSFIRSIST
ncbi:MAG: hypothetical protein HC923_10400 [Myxococcales bacterium]|nr:hypothetical protein [Myxococcales bacterium]